MDHTEASALRVEDETSERVDETETTEEKIDWNSITEDLPRDAVIGDETIRAMMIGDDDDDDWR